VSSVNRATIVVHIAQVRPFVFVYNHDSINYFEKGIDILRDICYTVDTEEKELLREAQGQAKPDTRNPGFQRNGVS